MDYVNTIMSLFTRRFEKGSNWQELHDPEMQVLFLNQKLPEDVLFYFFNGEWI